MSNVILAELSSDSIASVIGSTITVTASAPVLALCRKLIGTYARETPLEAWRGNTMCLRVRIGEGARLGTRTNSGVVRVCTGPSFAAAAWSRPFRSPRRLLLKSDTGNRCRC